MKRALPASLAGVTTPCAHAAVDLDALCAAGAGDPDSDVYDELALLHAARGDAAAARAAEARALPLRSDKP